MQFIGNHFRYYHINSICQELGDDKVRALQFFHVFSGSDATSQFSGKGKQTDWKTWTSYSTTTKGFAVTCLNAFVSLKFTSAAFKMFERFICTMYNTTTSHVKVKTRVKMIEQLPPPQSAVLQHVNRCMYQASI